MKNKCAGFSKTKDPKCNDQDGCEWKVLGYKNGTKLASGCWEKGNHYHSHKKKQETVHQKNHQKIT